MGMLNSNKPDATADLKTQRRDCRKRAMDVLARREHGCEELRRKLVNKGFAPELTVEVVAELKSDGLVADDRFAEAFVRSRIGRGQGPYRIEAELKERGIDAGLIGLTLDEADCDWVSLAQQVRTKRFGPQAPDDLNQRAKQSRFLSYRGFVGDQIRRALELADDTD
jgi:regulatory protein